MQFRTFLLSILLIQSTVSIFSIKSNKKLKEFVELRSKLGDKQEQSNGTAPVGDTVPGHYDGNDSAHGRVEDDVHPSTAMPSQAMILCDPTGQEMQEYFQVMVHINDQDALNFKVQQIFNDVDQDGSGEISKDEAKMAIRNEIQKDNYEHVSDEEVDAEVNRLFGLIDSNENDHVGFDELKSFIRHMYQDEKANLEMKFEPVFQCIAFNVFHEMDKNQNGTIEFDEAKLYFQQDIDVQHIQQVFNQNGPNSIDFEQFKQLYREFLQNKFNNMNQRESNSNGSDSHHPNDSDHGHHHGHHGSHHGHHHDHGHDHGHHGSHHGHHQSHDGHHQSHHDNYPGHHEQDQDQHHHSCSSGSDEHHNSKDHDLYYNDKSHNDNDHREQHDDSEDHQHHQSHHGPYDPYHGPHGDDHPHHGPHGHPHHGPHDPHHVPHGHHDHGHHDPHHGRPYGHHDHPRNMNMIQQTTSNKQTGNSVFLL